jgi:ribokinase
LYLYEFGYLLIFGYLLTFRYKVIKNSNLKLMLMAKKVKILVLGSLLFDCVTWGERLPKKGETVIGYRNGFFTGGKGANQAVQAARMGAEVHMIGRVGKDHFGGILLDALKKEGINIRHVTEDANTSTGTCCIHVDKKGANAIMIVPQANLSISTKDIDMAMDEIKDFDIFVTQLEVNDEATIYAIKQARAKGSIIVFNPAPAHSVPKDIFGYADYVILNETETEFFSGVLPVDDNSCMRAAKRLLKMGLKCVIITLGPRGVFYADNGISYLLPTFDADTVDTTAAGDAFNAAFATVLGEGMSVDEALMYGNAAGSIATTRHGAQSSLGYREEIDSMKNSFNIKKIFINKDKS